MRTGLMGGARTAWHFLFGQLLRKLGPSLLEVRDEVPLSDDPPRLDYSLLLRPDSAGGVVDDAVTLRRLWPMLPRVSVVEYKSPTRPYRPGHLDRLWGYVHIHFANQHLVSESPHVRSRDEVAAVLVVTSRTPDLDADVASMGLTWEECGRGYFRVRGGRFALYVAEIDVAGPADGDEFLYSLGNGWPTSVEARRFWLEMAGSKEAGMRVQDLEGFDEIVQKLLDSLPLEQRLAGMAPEQRLSVLAPEQRLFGLDRDRQAFALPIEVLRALPEGFLCTFDGGEGETSKEDIDDLDERIRKWLESLPPEQRLAGLTPDQLRAGLTPEQLLAGLDRDQQALALPREVLRALSDDYLHTLSPKVQAELRWRIERGGQ